MKQKKNPETESRMCVNFYFRWFLYLFNFYPSIKWRLSFLVQFVYFKLHLIRKKTQIFRYLCISLSWKRKTPWEKIPIGNPKSACLHFYTAKTQAALALPFLPYSTLRVEQCFDSGCLLKIIAWFCMLVYQYSDLLRYHLLSYHLWFVNLLQNFHENEEFDLSSSHEIQDLLYTVVKIRNSLKKSCQALGSIFL